MRTKRFFGVSWLTAAALLLFLFPVAGFGKGSSPCNNPTDLKSIVDAYAGSAVADGTSIGVAVAVVLKNQEPRFFSYGLANFTEDKPVTRDTIFQLGSVTKIFTTALLGEQVSRKMLSLDQPLSDFSAQVGTLQPLTSQVTLKELGDFTGGFPNLPPTHDRCPNVKGALPDNNDRPTICEYCAGDLAIYFQNVKPSNDPDKCDYTPVTSLPAHYNYSDISTGLIGLLLGGNPHQLLSNQALQGWYELVNHKIKAPLGMPDTILYSTDTSCLIPYATATPWQKARLAAGYGQALATAHVDDETTGRISSNFDLSTGGFGYQGLTPQVKILGGGGSGARAHAEVSGNAVQNIILDNPGSNYLNPPVITFTGGTSNTSNAAKAAAVIKDGKVVAIRILAEGSGYTSIPQVAISGGNRGPKARSATLGKVYVANGGVYYVEVADGGKGYVDPLTVIVAPGVPADNNIPIWAPAGALWSTTRDMIKLAQVALGDKYVGWRKIDKHLIQGFQIAEKPYACSTPNQSPCIESSGLAWAITRADGGLPQVISKNGGIEGASTEIRLVPSEDFAVVVLTNSRQVFEKTGQPTKTAGNISDNIVAAIVRNGLSDGKGWKDRH